MASWRAEEKDLAAVPNPAVEEAGTAKVTTLIETTCPYVKKMPSQ